MQKNLVYTLDDFGLSSLVDAHTVATVSPEHLKRIAVMVGLYDLSAHHSFLSRVPKLDLHLNSTEPHERHGESRTLVRRVQFATDYIFDGLNHDRIAGMWEEQIHTFRKFFGRSPDGLNSHEHVHMFPPLFKRACALARDYSIPYVRLGTHAVAARPLPIRDHLINMLRKQNFTNLQEASLETSSALWSADGKLSKEILDNLPDGTEIILHPDIPQDMELLSRR